MKRASLLLVPALLVFASRDAVCPGPPRPSGPAAAPAEVDLAALSARLSEPAGYFDTDNLISNESSYLQVAEQLAATVPAGGVYVGVGPEQNFSYIARVRPRYAFVLDIRRQNLLQHLLFAALFARADDARGYLCLLFSRPCAGAAPAGAGPAPERALAAMPLPSERAFSTNLEAAYEHIEGQLRFTLGAQDRADIRRIYRAFFAEQAGIRFRSFGRPLAAHHPDFRTLLAARSPQGRFGSFLDAPDDYRFVRDLSRRRRIIPVVGGFAGPHALRAIGSWTRAQGLAVSTFYTSNVEFYLMRDGAFDRFAANVRALPSGPRSVLIRACFDYGRPHPAARPGHRSVTLLQRLPRFLQLLDAGAYTHAGDLCTADYVDPATVPP